MTTYTFIGTKMHWTDTDGDGKDDTLTFGVSKLKLVVPDGSTSFSYTENGLSEGGSFINVELALSAYNITANGVRLDGSWDASTGRASAPGFQSDLLQFEKDGLNHLFVLGGDALPFSTPAELQAFAATGSIGSITTGPFVPGAAIGLADLATVSITQNDKILGSSDRDVFRGGKGNDKIFGKAGKDFLAGDKGKDRLDGGAGNDGLKGGAGRDSFVFKKGYGKDTVKDFQDDIDTIKLDDALWKGTLTKQQVINRFAEVVDGDLVFDFGKAELSLEGFSNLSEIKDDLEFI